tara:strand:+ start:54 stop:650 length:597 start_codon:yes stop_codon:yes gene_type:complete
MTLSIDGAAGISGVNGTASAPAIKGTDADTGLFFGTNTASIATAGSERLSVAANGNVQVGTTVVDANGKVQVGSTIVDANGKIGIGSTPTTDLDLNGNCASNAVAVSGYDIDCSLGNYFTKTCNGNSTFTISNVPTSRAFTIALEVTHTSGTLTWPAAIKWPADTPPTLTAGTTHLFVFVTDDGGTRWRGSALVDYVN